MNRNSLLALATLIALLWIESGNCKRKLQNDHEVDIAKRQQQQVVELKEWTENMDSTCEKLRDCQAKEMEKKKKEGTLLVPYNVMEFDDRLAKCGGVTPGKYQTWWKDVCMMGRRAEAEMADEDEADEDEDEEEDEEEDEDEADEAKSDEVDIAKRQKGLKILKAWKRDEAEMADVDEADEARSDKAQN